jgi:hypothetical protein
MNGSPVFRSRAITGVPKHAPVLRVWGEGHPITAITPILDSKSLALAENRSDLIEVGGSVIVFQP